MQSEINSRPLDLAADIPATTADRKALRTAKQGAGMGFERYILFLETLGRVSTDCPKPKRVRPQEPFEL